MKPISIFITNEEPLKFFGSKNATQIDGQDSTSNFFFECELSWNSFKKRCVLNFTLQDADNDTIIWKKTDVKNNVPTDDDELHALLRAFLLECCADLFLVGFYLFGSYEYNGQKWEVLLIHKVDALELPDGFDDL